ncbi:MAG: DNA polymerase I, partial [Lachnospiraceae bacterium]|nr:DNA polymerase I [Lachnospiraceae bacterium]
LEPLQLIEVKSLMGDTSDNIPGVKGIGEKTALALIQRFGSLEGVYAHLDDPLIKPKQRENLTACRKEAELSRVLGTIRRDAPIDTAPGSYALSEGDPVKALALLEDWEMLRMIERLGLRTKASREDPAGPPSETLPHILPSPLPDNPAGTWYLAQKEGEWFGVQDQRVCSLSREALIRLLDFPSAALMVFDSAPLYALALEAGGEGAAVRWDGKLAAYLLNPSSSRYEPESLAKEYQIQSGFFCETFPLAGSLAPLFEALGQGLKEQDMEPLYETIEFPLAKVLADMSRIGVLVDREGIEAFGEKISALAEEAEHAIYEKAGLRFNPNSPRQLGEVLFEKMGLPHGKKTKTGWSTDAATLEELRSQAPIIEDILNYRSYQKLKSTYVDGLLKAIGPDGRIHSRFNQTEARTGRLSSDDPNLQNIPIRTELGSQLRAYFTAPEGCLLVDADYSQIELRLLAHASGDAPMREAFRAGADIHRATAARIYHIPEIMVTPSQRLGAKAVNFGIMYGKGA